MINHTSDQHPWFQRAAAPRRAANGALLRLERYDRALPESADHLQGLRDPSNWAWDPLAKAYYWHRFFSHQPDLNYDNPAVASSHLSMLDFWLDHGRGRPAPGRDSLPLRPAKAPTAKTCRRPTPLAASRARSWTSITAAACFWPRPTSGRKTWRPISATATNATWPSISR